MEVKDLKIFARVAALQNLSAVATELGVTAGTITKRVQALEAELGVRLVERTTRHSRLTEEGRLFLPHVERVLGEMEVACDQLAANAGQPGGRLVISAPASLMRRLITPAIISFSAAYPAIDVRVDVTDAVTNLHEQGYDLAIRTGPLEDSPLKAKRLATDRMIVVAAPAYIDRHGLPETPQDLARHQCLIHGEQRMWTLYHADHGRAPEQVKISGRIASDSGAFLNAVALEGAGLLRASQISVAEDIANGRLQQVLPDYALSSDAAISVVYPNAKHTMPRVRAFIDHLAEFCRARQVKANARAIEPNADAGPQTGNAQTERAVRLAPRATRNRA